MDLKVAEKTYSGDNYDPSLCVGPDGNACWMAWAAYEKLGSRVFARHFDGSEAGEILSLSETECMQTRPLCIPSPSGVTFVWFEKTGLTYRIVRREHDGAAFSEPRVIHQLPEGAKPWELQAEFDAAGDLWLVWSQAVTGQTTIEVIVQADGKSVVSHSVSARSRANYRPRIVPFRDSGVYLVWDAYVDNSYSVHGCVVASEGPRDLTRISRDVEWENKATVCRGAGGGLWAVWVRCRDVIYRDSVIHQKFSLRGARFDGRTWEALPGNDGEDIAPLHYGLLTDFSVHPQLGHMGRRLHPILKADNSGGVWLFYEVKADQGAFTLESKGRFFAHRCMDGKWSGPLNLAEGSVFYELPHNRRVSGEVCFLARDVENDELHLQKATLSTDLPTVPAESRAVDLTGWREITFPLPETQREEREINQLAGEDKGRYTLLWGDFHCHSAASVECEGEPDELAHYARDKSLIDALTISDNDYFWSRFVRKNQRYLKDAEWDYVLGNAKALNDPGRFAMFPGYEMTIGGKHRKERNHISTMADDDEMEMDLLHFDDAVRQALDEGGRRTNRSLRDCIEWARRKGYLLLPHAHVNWWTLLDSDIQVAVDVYAAWEPNIELYDIYFDYLNEGRRFGFTGSSDSHYRNPGFGGALTGIWAERLDRAAIIEAIRARRTYATAGGRIVVEFTINDRVIGSSLTVAEDPILKWRVRGADEEYVLRIHRDGRLMHEDFFVAQTDGELQDENFVKLRFGEHYYHLEVRSLAPVPQYPSNVAHALGGKAWTTPIWVKAAEHASD